jgi:predicted esterase
MIVHGDRDDVVDPRHGEHLRDVAKALGVRAEYLPVQGGDHNGVVDTQEVREAISGFFSRELHAALRSD